MRMLFVCSVKVCPPPFSCPPPWLAARPTCCSLHAVAYTCTLEPAPACCGPSATFHPIIPGHTH
eukprot:223925-Chlamydomonas_euryale.AAC.1